MTDGQSQNPKTSSIGFLKDTEKWFKKKFSRSHRQSTPSASGQENLGGEMSSVRHAIVSPCAQLTNPVIGASAATSQRDQHKTPTQDGAASISPPLQLHGHLSIANDYARVTLSFTEMLLKKLPDAVESNAVNMAFGIPKIILQIKEGVEDNLDAVDRRILSTADQLRMVKEALAGWEPNNAEERQGMKLFETALAEEWTNLIKLKEQSLSRKIAVHEEDKKRIAEIFERINQAREQLVVVTGLRVRKTVLAIQEDVAKFLLEQLKVSHTADHKCELEGEKRQLLRRAVCTPGTRVRILGEITRWANDTSSESQSVYWLFGHAGSGKSTIAYTIARRFEFAGDADDTIVLGGNFFCSRQFEETRFATRIIRTIVYQLALRCKAFADALAGSGKFDTVHHNVRVQLVSLLVEPWEQARLADSSRSARFLVVIDALDEIEGQGGSDFLWDLFDVINKYDLPGLKFFVTSRSDPGLVSCVESFEDRHFYRLEEVPIDEAQADITTYLNTNLTHFTSQDIDEVVTLADGLFIYAATVVKYLGEHTPPEQEKLLKKLLSASNTASATTLLDELYIQVLLHVFGGFKGDILSHRLHILYTFLCTAERTSTSVTGLLTGDSDSDTASDDVLRRLYAVLYTENDKVLWYHKSFPDFLFDKSRSKDFWCNEVEHHQRLAESCFRVMEAGLRFNIANTPSSFILDGDNSTLSDAVKQNISPVLSYSCRNWDHHLSAVTLAHLGALRRSLSEFLELRVLSWIEAMNLLDSRGLCDPMLQTARRWVINNGPLMTALAVSSDGKRIVFGSNGKSVRVWDSPTGEILMVLAGHTSMVSSVAFSADDRRIVSGSWNHSVRVWDSWTGEMLKVLEGHTSEVSSVAFSTDGRRIISGSWDHSVRVWDSWTGETLKVLKGHTSEVSSVAFSTDDRRIVSGSWDHSVRVWDSWTGEMVKVLKGHTSGVSSVALSTDGRRVISGSGDNSVRVWDSWTGEMVKVLEGHTSGVSSIAFSTDGRRIISASFWDNLVRVWDSWTGEMVKVLEGHTSVVWSVAFSGDGRRAISASWDNSVRVWDSWTGEMVKVLEGHTSEVSSVAF